MTTIMNQRESVVLNRWMGANRGERIKEYRNLVEFIPSKVTLEISLPSGQPNYDHRRLELLETRPFLVRTALFTALNPHVSHWTLSIIRLSRPGSQNAAPRFSGIFLGC
uniref:Uncharacterized protein n=1 Tax=Compsopogon caeruleus TaxID=31354 RepID=A0A7S1THE0_9RHOD|mmetsp:Transcript_6640/g.13470  ORF Transcript_6640/g.13470 Transcript_6640/m.13470 type:complete len:109 (+) Transcript_6640:110-436(+)